MAVFRYSKCICVSGEVAGTLGKHSLCSVCIQEVELAHSSSHLLSEWVCAAHYLSVVWFPLGCRLTQDWFVVRMATSLASVSPNQPLKPRDFSSPVPQHCTVSTQWPQWLCSILCLIHAALGLILMLIEGAWQWHVFVGCVFMLKN